MRRSAIVVMCALLVATLISPGIAMAKGGNGRHSVATRETSRGKTTGAGKGNARETDAGGTPGKTAKSKAASAQQGTTAKNIEMITPGAPSAEAIEKSEKPQSATYEQLASATLSTKAVSDSAPSTGPAEEQISSNATVAADVETRGVLDTIRVKVNASLEGVRAIVAGWWSALASWFGD